MTSSLYTQVIWDIKINDELTANHKLKIVLFNISNRISGIQEYLELIFPSNYPFKDIVTKIEGTKMSQGYGYSLGDNKYHLKFKDLPKELQTKDEINIELSFKQEKCSDSVLDGKMLEVGFAEQLRASSIDLTFYLPSYGGFKKFIYLLIAKLRGKKTIYEITPTPNSGTQPTNMDKNNGVISYKFKRVTPNFGFTYRLAGKVDWLSLGIGLASGIIISILVKIILELISKLFSNLLIFDRYTTKC